MIHNPLVAATIIALVATNAIAQVEPTANEIAWGNEAILEHAGVGSFDDLIGKDVTLEDGTLVGTIKHFTVMGDAAWAIIKTPDGKEIAHSVMRMQYRGTHYTSEDPGLRHEIHGDS